MYRLISVNWAVLVVAVAYPVGMLVGALVG